MSDFQLNEVDGDDLDDILSAVESSFNLKFGSHELQHVATFGELCDIIVSKITLQEAPDCTSQQAFYKLRKALSFVAPTTMVLPNTELKNLLPWRKRRQLWRLVEKQLGFTHNLIGMSGTMAVIVAIAFLASPAAFFINGAGGAAGLASTIVAAIILEKTGRSLRANTVRECVEQMIREQYLKSRRNPNTFNRAEVVEQVQALFIDRLALEPSDLTADARFS